MATNTRPRRTVRPPRKPYAEYEDNELEVLQHDTGRPAKTRTAADSSRKREAQTLDSYDPELSESEYELDEEDATDTGIEQDSEADSEADSEQDSNPARDTRGRSRRPFAFGKPKQKTGLSAAAAPRGRVSVARYCFCSCCWQLQLLLGLNCGSG